MSKKIKVKIVENGLVFESISACAQWIASERGLSFSSTKIRISRCLSGKPHKKVTKYKTKDGMEHLSFSSQLEKTINIYTVKECK